MTKLSRLGSSLQTRSHSFRHTQRLVAAVALLKALLCSTSKTLFVRSRLSEFLRGQVSLKLQMAESSDGRLVKAHPLTFPTGCGDLRQPRLRTDSSPVEWTQSQFRYLDGCVVSILRVQRPVWACFNTASLQLSRRSGSLLHTQTGCHALSKAALRELVNAVILRRS